MKPSVYVESTIPSFLVGEPSEVTVTEARRIATKQWWERKRGNFDLYISSIVEDEIAKGDSRYAEERLALVTGLMRLDVTDEVVTLANELFRYLHLPEGARNDALHLSLSCYYEIEYLLTLNLRHIAHGRVRASLARLHDKTGLIIPVICTPDELLLRSDLP